MSFQPYVSSPTDALRQQSALTQVYAWMTAGLLTTGAIAAFVAGNAAMTRLVYGAPMVFFGLLIVELIMVMVLSASIGRIAPGTATALFMVYAALNGLTLSVVFLVYTRASIASTFFVTAGTFGAMSLYGYTTKRDLSGWGNFLLMALIGLILAGVANWFLRSPAIYWITTIAGVFIFVGLTAYDTQKIKTMIAGARTEREQQNIAVYGALSLYLDFINLFLYMLRIFGNRK